MPLKNEAKFPVYPRLEDHISSDLLPQKHEQPDSEYLTAILKQASHQRSQKRLKQALKDVNISQDITAFSRNDHLRTPTSEAEAFPTMALQKESTSAYAAEVNSMVSKMLAEQRLEKNHESEFPYHLDSGNSSFRHWKLERQGKTEGRTTSHNPGYSRKESGAPGNNNCFLENPRSQTPATAFESKSQLHTPANERQQKDAELQKLRAELKSLFTSKKNLEIKVTSLLSTTESLEEEKTRFTSDLRKLVEESAAMKWRVSELENENENLRRNLELATKEKNELFLKFTEINEEKESLKNLVVAVQSKFSNIAQENFQLQSRSGEFNVLQDHYSNLLGEIRNFKSERAELLMKIDVLESEHSYCSVLESQRAKQTAELQWQIRMLQGEGVHRNTAHPFPPRMLSNPENMNLSYQRSASSPRDENLDQSLSYREFNGIDSRSRRDSVGGLLRESVVDPENERTCLTKEETEVLDKRLTILAIEKKAVEAEMLRIPSKQPGRVNADREKLKDLEQRLNDIDSSMQSIRLKIREAKSGGLGLSSIG